MGQLDIFGGESEIPKPKARSESAAFGTTPDELRDALELIARGDTGVVGQWSQDVVTLDGDTLSSHVPRHHARAVVALLEQGLATVSETVRARQGAVTRVVDLLALSTRGKKLHAKWRSLSRGQGCTNPGRSTRER
ncbi:hypothetical protein [Actinoalloteichus spitiensis]|uniref:hypothetical protein n=1 Tax=Actinoalloteichus spitiensis TaxID=252394 RepID=UPI0002F90080|nr:hypothetical protein [Actinoalloteichus spitiensis]